MSSATAVYHEAVAIPPPDYTFTVSARSTLTGAYAQSRTITVRVLPGAWLIVNTPVAGSVTSLTPR